MKAHKFYVPKTGQGAIRVEEDELRRFYPYMHYHEEVQITLIRAGNGILFAGAGLIEFDSGDVFILGSNLPHVFKNNPANKKVAATSIYFPPQMGGRQFWEMEETEGLLKVIKDSNKGFKIDNANSLLSQSIKSYSGLSSSKKLSMLLSILDMLGTSRGVTISTLEFNSPPAENQTQRMDELISYISKNYDRPISLEEIAGKASMTPESFCRFFKKKTRKTFTRYLNELRVSHAIRLIIKGNLSISEIAYLCGFRNLSNFNRQFLIISGKRPGEITRI